jgi:hypothetical protein
VDVGVFYCAQKCSKDNNINILIIQIEVFMYELFSVRFLTTEAMIPLLPSTARHWFRQ